MVLGQMLHITQCILYELFGYFAGGPQEKFYRIFTAMMNTVAYACVRKEQRRLSILGL